MQLITIIGNIGSDVEQKSTNQGGLLTQFRVAVNNYRKETAWYRIVIWPDKLAPFEKVLPHLKKGSLICIAGELKNPTCYTDKNGQPQVSLEIYPSMIKFVGGKKEEAAVDLSWVGNGGIGVDVNAEESDLPF